MFVPMIEGIIPTPTLVPAAEASTMTMSQEIAGISEHIYLTEKLPSNGFFIDIRSNNVTDGFIFESLQLIVAVELACLSLPMSLVLIIGISLGTTMIMFVHNYSEQI